jgi:hypothetical protein
MSIRKKKNTARQHTHKRGGRYKKEEKIVATFFNIINVNKEKKEHS